MFLFEYLQIQRMGSYRLNNSDPRRKARLFLSFIIFSDNQNELAFLSTTSTATYRDNSPLFAHSKNRHSNLNRWKQVKNANRCATITA